MNARTETVTCGLCGIPLTEAEKRLPDRSCRYCEENADSGSILRLTHERMVELRGLGYRLEYCAEGINKVGLFKNVASNPTAAILVTSSVELIGSWPTGGIAVRLTGLWPWAGNLLDIGDIGIVDGYDDQPYCHLRIIWKFSAYRDNHLTSCSGGPGTIGLPAELLVPTQETMKVRFWKFKDALPSANNSVVYWLDVPVWEWDGKGYN